ncbi:MAG: hypothetical protein KC636_32085, partial [Myxococcales bacterium]|nr:hypothetical protein [Myxococcales bacterium]
MAATRSQCTNTLRRRALPRRRLALLLTLAACSSEGAGDGALDVLVEAEDVIIHGLQPGDGIEDIRDGWAVDFDQYIAVLGGVQLHLSTDETVEAEAPEIYAIDLTKIPAAGASQWTLEGLAEGRYEFLYGLHGAGEAAQHESVDDADFAELQANDWTYLIAGAIEQVGGVSCPPASLASPPAGAVSAGMNRAGDTCYANPAISFRLGATAETSFGPCEIDGVPGVSVSAGTVVTVAVTIHGDHIFFNGFPE